MFVWRILSKMIGEILSQTTNKQTCIEALKNIHIVTIPSTCKLLVFAFNEIYFCLTCILDRLHLVSEPKSMTALKY